MNVLQDVDKFLELGKNSTIGDQNELQNLRQDERSKGLYQSAQKIRQNIQKLVVFYESNAALFTQLKTAHFQVKDNLEFLEAWSLAHKSFGKSLETLHTRIVYNHTFRANKALGIMIAIFGLFITSVLLVIYHRVSSTSQISIKV